MPDGAAGKLVVAPLFPLGNVVLAPGIVLPLHVFEPRYRALLAWTLAHDRTIAMAVHDHHRPTLAGGEPALHPIVGLGRIVQHVPFEDGRSNLLLEGTLRCRLVAEDRSRAFRVGTLQPLASHASDPGEALALANMLTARIGVQSPKPIADANECSEVADKVLMVLSLDALTRQTLFATLDVNARLRALHRVLDGLTTKPDPDRN